MQFNTPEGFLDNFMFNYNYMKQIDYISCHNMQGKVFGMHLRDTIASEGEVEFAMKIPPSTTKKIEALPTIVTVDKTVHIDFYADVAVTGGSNVKDNYVICMNQFLNYESSVSELLAGATINTSGPNVINTFKDFIPANKYTGGTSRQIINWITKADCYYSAKLDNKDNSICTYSMILYWIEHDV